MEKCEPPGVKNLGVLRVEPKPSVEVLNGISETRQILNGEFSLSQLAIGDTPDNESFCDIGVGVVSFNCCI